MVGACLLSVPAFAQPAGDRHVKQEADAALASMQLQNDPFAPVHIVMSRKSFDGMPDLVSNAVAKADTAGTALVVPEINAYMLAQVSGRIHQRENRCGGFFAFATRAEADALVRSDR